MESNADYIPPVKLKKTTNEVGNSPFPFSWQKKIIYLDWS
jgi:hypothetical protein